MPDADAALVVPVEGEVAVPWTVTVVDLALDLARQDLLARSRCQ